MVFPHGFVEGVDYVIRAINRNHPILVMSIHGGSIEPFTSEIAESIAGTDYSFYDFRGIMNKSNKVLHIPSIYFNDSKLATILSNCKCAISIHGEKSIAENFVCIGGLNYTLSQLVIEQLIEIGIEVRDLGTRFRGMNPSNVVNRPSYNGVQIEISRGLRYLLEISNSTPHSGESIFDGFVNSIRISITAYLPILQEYIQ